MTVDVLHVDDESSAAETTARMLEHVDDRLAVTVETDPASALDRVGKFDCVVADHEMPGIDGIDVVRRTAERHPDVPVVLFTASEDGAVAAAAADAGAAGVVRKQEVAGYAAVAERVRDAVGT